MKKWAIFKEFMFGHHLDMVDTAIVFACGCQVGAGTTSAAIIIALSCVLALVVLRFMDRKS